MSTACTRQDGGGRINHAPKFFFRFFNYLEEACHKNAQSIFSFTRLKTLSNPPTMVWVRSVFDGCHIFRVFFSGPFCQLVEFARVYILQYHFWKRTCQICNGKWLHCWCFQNFELWLAANVLQYLLQKSFQIELKAWLTFFCLFLRHADQRWFWRREGSGGDCHVCDGWRADLCAEGHWSQVDLSHFIVAAFAF